MSNDELDARCTIECTIQNGWLRCSRLICHVNHAHTPTHTDCRLDNTIIA